MCRALKEVLQAQLLSAIDKYVIVIIIIFLLFLTILILFLVE